MKTLTVEERGIREIKEAEQDSVWVAEHYAHLRRKYNREFIAVHHRRVVDHDRNGARLAKRLKARYRLDEPGITVTYVTKEKVDLIL